MSNGKYFEEDLKLLRSLGLDLKKSLNSPIREDRHKSFSIYINREGNIRWKDFGTGEGGTVKQLYELLNGKRVELKGEIFYEDNIKNDIKINVREYSDRDIEYWGRYYVSKDILDRYNVKSLDSFEYKKKVYYNKLYMFSIRYYEGVYKIYMPYSKMKFFHNCLSDMVFGQYQIDKSDKRVIITKSFKDVLVLRVLGYNGISVMSETINPDSIRYYMDIFRDNGYRVYLLFDNDRAGMLNSVKWVNRYDIKLLLLDRYKDISDYIYNVGYDTCKDYISYFV